ncbi:MAG: alpha-mannosidase [Phycisphaerae bacterium]|nr:alpha-mannosidase [Phycisphaerae bacterium]
MMQNILEKLDALKRRSDNSLQPVKRWLERFASELEFADGLNRLQGPAGGGWDKLIAKAYSHVTAAVAVGKVDRIPKAVREAEELLSPIGKAGKKYTAHCVGHAHIDMNWMWGWAETVAATNDTFLTVLQLMDEFPDFCFTQSQASVYEIMRKHNPEAFERIRARVAEGRWEIAAPTWVEGDKNLVSGESLTRHLLYTRRYMKEHFDLAPEDSPLDWAPDTFGHAATIPSILTRGGVTRYYMCRGGAFDKPPVFWWEGPDGNRILVNLEHTWYHDALGSHNIKGLLAFCEKTKLRDWMLVYGIGDHGGGPTRRDLKQLREMNTWPIYPNFQFATTKRYYEILEAAGDDLPVLKRELNYEFTGCYTSQARIKRTNRLGENRLQNAEAAAAIAWRAAGKAYPGASLREAWIHCIFNHFHDILPGSGVRETREYNSALFQQTAAVTTSVKANSLRALAVKIDTSFGASDGDAPAQALGAGVGRGAVEGAITTAGGCFENPGRVFVVFNPTARQRREVVTLSVWDAENDDVRATRFRARTADGEELPTQRVGNGVYWSHGFVDLAVPVKVPALGYTTLVVEPAGMLPKAGQPGYERLIADEIKGAAKNHRANINLFGQYTGSWILENESIRATFDPNTGAIVELVDKATDTRLITPENPAGVFEYALEQPGEMTSWVIQPLKTPPRPLAVESFKSVAQGPHVASFQAVLSVGDSKLNVTYSLKAGQPRLDIDVKVDWLERGGPGVGILSLRAVFPLALSDAKANYEIPFGSIRRDEHEGEEVPALHWADVTGKLTGQPGTGGLTLLNDSKHGHSLDGSTLRLTLLRSSYDPDPLPDLGDHTFRLALIPHGKALKPAELTRLGASFNRSLIAVATDVHTGELPAAGLSGASVKPGNVILTCLKKAEDEDALIVRLTEADGKAAAATVSLDPTLLGKVAKAVEVDFLERELNDSTAKATPTGFNVHLPAHGIASVKVTFAG